MKVDLKSVLLGAVLVFAGYIMGASDFGRLVAQDPSPPPGFFPVDQDLPRNAPTDVGRFTLVENFGMGYSVLDTKTGDYFTFDKSRGGWLRVAPSIPSHL